MLITFSGIVGSGKSTNAKHIVNLLGEQGYSPIYLRFRFVTWRNIFKPLPAKQKTAHDQRKTRVKAPKRRRHYQPTVSLTFIKFMGYLWRMFIFRIFAWLRLRQRITIINRFFYDNFAHYHLTGRIERFYLWVLKKTMPVPDLALILIAEPKVILGRRPHYDAEYVHELCQSYLQVVREFPNLVVIRTDNVDNLSATIAQRVEAAVGLVPEMASGKISLTFF